MAIPKKHREEAKSITKKIADLKTEQAKYLDKYPPIPYKVVGSDGKIYENKNYEGPEALKDIKAGKVRSIYAIWKELIDARSSLEKLVGTTEELFDEYYTIVQETQSDLDWIKEFRDKMISNSFERKPAEKSRLTKEKVKKNAVPTGPDSFLIPMSGEVLEDLLDRFEHNTDMLHQIALGKNLGVWITEEQAAKQYKTTSRTLLKFRNEGKIPFSNPAGMNTIMYKREDLEKFFNDDPGYIKRLNKNKRHAK